MIAISVKKDSVNFLSAFYSKSEFVINDFGNLSFKGGEFNSKIISKILNRKKIKNSNIVSKKCMICINPDEVFFNQIHTSEKIDSTTLIDWNNDLMFSGAHVGKYNDLHYQIGENDSMLSVYIDRSKQSDYYNFCKESNLKISCLSIDIFSAEYLARDMFEAGGSGDYIIWGVGREKDDIMIVQDNNFIGLVTFKRLKGDVEVMKCVGNEKYLLDCLSKISNENFSDLKSVDFVKKIYMYQKVMVRM